ncbi:MAG: heme biosynthesis protein HemY [Legionellales bacterium]|nr:heme biosynthesis protein HemY [Legionellales bacterium]
MKFLLCVLIIFFLAIWAGVKIAADPGYALFAYQHWTVQMPLWIAAALLILGFILLHNLLLLIRGTGALAKKIRAWRKQRRLNASHRLTKVGLCELAEGKWASAENLLIKAIQHNPSPLINYLAAARAAQEQGDENRRDEYLRKAHESTPDSALAIGLTQAQLQFNQKQLEHSLATLRHLQHLEPENQYVLKMLRQLYQKLVDWNGIVEILPELRKRKVFPSEELINLEKQAYAELLTQFKSSASHQQLDELWQRIPRSLKRDPLLLQRYVDRLIIQHRDEEAEHVIRGALKNDWQPELIRLYGLLSCAASEKQLEIAESWLKQYGNSGVLFLTLGRLCLRNHLWGQARHYFESALALEPCPELYAEFGRLLEHIGQTNEAIEKYRQGLLGSMVTVSF